MPFAKKFRAMMDLPLPGDTLGDLAVEQVEVHDVWGAPDGYAYAVRMVLRGPGGQQGVRRALAPLFSAHPTTFSAYGNPYQLWFHKPEIESLGGRRYEVKAQGAGMRIQLEPELHRFLAYLEREGLLAEQLSLEAREALIQAYLDGYRAEIKRLVGRYQRRLARSTIEAAAAVQDAIAQAAPGAGEDSVEELRRWRESRR